MQLSRRSSALILVVSALALIAAVKPLVKIDKNTHLGVPVSAIMSLRSSGVVAPDNSAIEFIYDNGPEFSVPAGYSFVVTDIHIRPESGTLSTNDRYLVVVNIGSLGSRSFTSMFSGIDDRSYAFSTGMVIPSGGVPTVRNVLSSRPIVAQLQGYFVHAKAIAENADAFESDV